MLDKRKVSIALVFSLTIILGFTTGFLVRPYININTVKNTTLVPSPSPLLIDSFSRIPIYDTFNLGLHIGGKIFFENKEGVFISSGNGNDIKKLLDNDPTNRKKFITLDAAQEKFYYSALKDGTEYVYKKDLVSGKEEEVFHFIVDDKNEEFFGTNVAVSSDDKWLAISDKEGLMLYSILNKQTKKLATNVITNCQSSFGTCFKYTSPTFSANNSYLASTRIVYEGAAMEIFDLNTLTRINNNYPSGIIEWSKQKNGLAILGNGYSSGISLATTPGNKLTNLASIYKDLETASIQSLDWSKDQRLVFIYTVGDYIHGSSTKAISYDLRDNSFRTIFEITNEQNSYSDQALWLPETDGIVFKNTNGEVWLVREDGRSKSRFPFDASRILLVK